MKHIHRNQKGDSCKEGDCHKCARKGLKTLATHLFITLSIVALLVVFSISKALAQTDIVILQEHKNLLELEYNVINNDIHFLEENLQKRRQKLQETTCKLVEVKQDLGLEIKNPSDAMRLCPKVFIQTTQE